MQEPVSTAAPDPTRRFDERAEWYVRHRPGYPEAAYSALLDGLGDPARLRALDLGAGTGISSLELAQRGPRVLAVEPSARMRELARPHPRVEWLDARAEALPLQDRSFELALAAQAFHWFEPARALREIARVLVPGGRLALLWNVRDLTDPLTAEYSDLVARATGRAREDAFHLWPEELTGSGLFGTCWERSFSNEQPLDAAGLLGRALSASYVPLDARARAQLEDSLGAAHARHRAPDGLVRLRYRTRLYLGESRGVGA